MEEQSRIRYEIAYDVTRQEVIVYPQWRGTRPNFHVIGGYTPENPRADLSEYVAELGEAITDALVRVGQPSIEPFKVRITPLDGQPEVLAKDFRGVLERVPVEEQVPVSANTTAAQALEEEQENGTPEKIASLATQKVHAMEAAAETEERVQKATTKTATKKATKKSTK